MSFTNFGLHLFCKNRLYARWKSLNFMYSAMAITDKTRKILWAKSGNRCSICRIELVQQPENMIHNVIIGEECHIISEKKKGPRGKDEYSGDFDHYDNLILLCANDHKRVDELTIIYTTGSLRKFKEVHENWVKTTLERDVSAFTNDEQNIKSLKRITSGKQIAEMLREVNALNFENDELKTAEEANKIGGLFEELQDYSDCLDLIGIAEVIKLEVLLNDRLEDLKEIGFLLFGLRRKIKITNDNVGFWNTPGDWDISTIVAVRNDNASIIGDFIIAKFPKQSQFFL